MSAQDNSRLTMYIDGASRGNPGPAAVGVVLLDAVGRHVLSISSYIGETTNNQAEYRALITGLTEAAKLNAGHLDIKSDSELLVRQITGRYRVRNADLMPLFRKAKGLLQSFGSFSISHIPRKQNAAADALANQALDAQLRGR